LSIIPIYTILIFVIILSVLYSCEKDGDNVKPIVNFIQPKSDIIVTHDTVLTFFVEAIDEDGKIVKVDFIVNGKTVKTVYDKPYKFVWNGANLNNIRIHNIKAKAYDDKGAYGKAVLRVGVRDFRDKFLGNFKFELIKESWIMVQPKTYDTAYFDGVIRKFKPIDSENDLYFGDDNEENANEKITIELKPKFKVTSIIDDSGVLTPKYAPHYYHYGKFVDIDTIKFSIDGFGFLGSGWNYDIIGIRQK